MGHMGLVDGCSDDIGFLERGLIFRTAALEPADQVGDGLDVLRKLYRFLTPASLLPYPGEIEQFDTHYSRPISSTCCTPARK
jgi:hypothetical protein